MLFATVWHFVVLAQSDVHPGRTGIRLARRAVLLH